MSFIATAVIGGAVVGAGASLIGSKKSAKAIQSSGDAAADAQVQAAQIGADTQKEMFYKSLGLQAPQRYAGNLALESLMREVYGADYNMPNQYSAGQATEPGGSRSTSSTRFVPLDGGSGSRLVGGATGPIVDRIRQAYDPTGAGQRARTMPYYGAGATPRPTGPTGTLPGHAPPIDTETSALYKLQQEEGTKAITAALAARGLNASGTGMGSLSDFYRKLSAQEAMRKQALIESIAGYGTQASSQGAQAAMGLGGSLAGIYSGMGDARANALLNAGQARANNYMNTANTVGSLANLGVTMYGMGAFGGGGGGTPTGVWV